MIWEQLSFQFSCLSWRVQAAFTSTFKTTNNKSCTRCKAFPTTCKILHEVGFFRLVWGRFVSLQLVRMVFRSFLSPHLGRTFLPLRSKVLTAVWACRPLHPL